MQCIFVSKHRTVGDWSATNWRLVADHFIKSETDLTSTATGRRSVGDSNPFLNTGISWFHRFPRSRISCNKISYDQVEKRLQGLCRLLMLEVPGSIPAGGEESLLVRTRFLRVIRRNDMIQCAVLRIGTLTGAPPPPPPRVGTSYKSPLVARVSTSFVEKV